MADPKHIQLSSYIKNVHLNLREKSRKLGFNAAWEDHCRNKTVLEEYATSMQTLATQHWDKNMDTSDKVISRINWIHDNCCGYYPDGLLKQRARELEIADKIETKSSDLVYSRLSSFDKLKVLDVGSCYNPFDIYGNFIVTAIDIAPSCKDVLECDFINVKISTDNVLKDNTVISLQQCSFDVVIFSLFLEYIPCADVRLQCCKKAYDLLDGEGLLVLVTPDSKHVGANAKFMKSWRFALSKIGFSRIKYEKLPYLHCMLFRKSICVDITRRWTDMHQQDGLYDKIFIPQDFNFDKQ